MAVVTTTLLLGDSGQAVLRGPAHGGEHGALRRSGSRASCGASRLHGCRGIRDAVNARMPQDLVDLGRREPRLVHFASRRQELLDGAPMAPPQQV